MDRGKKPESIDRKEPQFALRKAVTASGAKIQNA